MKKIIYPALIATMIVTSAFTVVKNITTWKVKEEAYSVKFTSPKFEGVFKGLKSELIFDENNLSESKLSASIETTTLNTGNGMRNKHAQQGLESDKYKTVKFSSTTITKSANGYIASGSLTVKDVTKTISIPFTFAKNTEGGVFSGTFSIKPADYNVKKKGTPELLDFQLNIPVTK